MVDPAHERTTASAAATVVNSLQTLVDEWVNSNEAMIATQRLTLTMSYQVAHEPTSVTLNLDGPARLGSLTLWDSGAAEIHVGRIDDGRVTVRSDLRWANDIEALALCDRLADYVLSREP